MTSWIIIIAFFVTVWHLVALIGYVMIGKLLFLSKFGMFRAVTQPDRAMKTAKSGFGKILHHLSWAIVGSVIIAVLL